MKNILKKKAFLVLASIALLLTVTVSSTLAYLLDRTESVTNTFGPSYVDVEIKDKVENGVKSKVVITNTSNINAYIRAKVVANWRDDNGKIVAGWTGTIGTPGANWSYNDSDKFYYYANPVAPGQPVPDNLFDTYEATGGPEGAHLVMDIIVQAVQAEGTGATTAEKAFEAIAITN